MRAVLPEPENETGPPCYGKAVIPSFIRRPVSANFKFTWINRRLIVKALLETPGETTSIEPTSESSRCQHPMD
jgi:hypothetical protein